ncbi:unnamed protein product [Staurois parvus]|uniref:Uncharacterized protein n=2 Tax=Staurois parvus TaxID=386267 RepID=A0ABN9FWP5_9NEOB|nr:unnamed protein product [Staurois parvus]
MSAWSCDQLCPITADHMALMISVAPEVLPVSVHQCQLSVLNSATCQCPPVPHISANLSCPSVPPNSASQCHLSVPVSAAYQCHISVLPFSAH